MTSLDYGLFDIKMEIIRLTSALIGILMIYALAPAHARPQFQNDMAEADGFVFDGPADRPEKFSSNTGRTTPLVDPTASLRTTENPGNTAGTTTTTPSPEMARCMQNCPVTGQYNPVCGSDNVVYSNMGRLDCAASCGQPVTFRYFGQCTSNIRGK